MKIPTVRNEERPNNQKGEHHKVWIKRKDNLNDYECGIALQAQNNNIGEWYAYSGCSKHMAGIKSDFVNIQKDKGFVSFINSNSTKVLGKGTVKFGSKNSLAENFLLVDNMKHNLLSVSQMCDQGHELIFNSRGCKIRKQGSRKLVATATRTPNNIYVLDEIESEKCHLGKEDES